MAGSCCEVRARVDDVVSISDWLTDVAKEGLGLVAGVKTPTAVVSAAEWLTGVGGKGQV